MKKNDMYFMLFTVIWALLYIVLPYLDFFSKSQTFLTYGYLVLLTIVYIIVFIAYANKYVEKLKM